MYTSTMLPLILSIVLSIIHCSEASDLTSLARGWGDGINWMTLEDGIVAAKERNCPVMLVIHKTWCGACKALKPIFAASTEIASLSSQFVMVNAEDEEEPEGTQYRPDGGYIPRILFLESSGAVITKIINEHGSEKYKFYYSSAIDIVQSMKKALSSIPYKINDEL